MEKFFNLDNPFYGAISKAVDAIYLSILWFVCCIPIITVGDATTALYYTINKTLKNDRGHLTTEFFRAFKSNFKQSTFMWLIFLCIYAFLGIDYHIMKMYVQEGVAIGQFYGVFLVIAVIIIMWGFYVFPYIARFENTTKNVLKNTAIIAISNVQWTILMFVLFLVMWIAVYVFVPIVFVMPVLYNYLKSIIIEKVFKKYMTKEQIEREEERNRINL